MKNGSPQKEQLFCSFLNVTFLEKNVICTFWLTKCIRKGQKNCSFWLHEEWLSPQKEIFFLFFSERHLSRKKTSFVLFALPNASEKDKKNCSFWLHEEWLSPQKERFFCSFLNVVFLEKKTSFVLFALPNASEKDKKNCSFWLHEEWLSPQKEQIFCSFLERTSIVLFAFLEKNCSFCEEFVLNVLYILPCQMHQKRTKKLFLLTTWRMALTTKRAIILFLSESHLSRKKTSFVLFALPNASEKDKKIVPFDYMKNGSHHKKNNFFFLFWTSSF